MPISDHIRDCDQLSGNGGYDDFVRLASLSEAIGEGLQTWVVMCCD
ncbi:hypothetical protein EPIB2_991 [Tritonibacter mobilis]|nr:hypothetical protein EPIB2_991 [Tritonibacter mobilis]